MSLRLVIEHAPSPQPRAEFSHAGGDVTIGRGGECDWQLDDPEMIISRRHCVVTVRDGQYLITDSSRGGVFLDGAASPLGAGNTAPLEDGMRIRLGDVVIRAEIQAEMPRAAAPPPASGGRDLPPISFEEDDFFKRPVAPVVSPKRPEGAPVPFGAARPAQSFAPPPIARPRPPTHPDDPFLAESLSRVVVRAADLSQPPRPVPASEPAAPRPPLARDPFGLAPEADVFAGDLGFDPPPPPPPSVAVQAPPPPPPPPPPSPVAAATPVPVDAAEDLRAAFLRGLGLDAADLAALGSEVEDMEALGQRFRQMTEGVVQMLRTRAREKGSVRVAQTVIGSTDVNPMKFLASTEEILAALVKRRGAGYLGPEEAIAAAFRDLSDHQMRTWIGLQAALRQMIDRFDPLAFEREADTAGTLKSILSGGRGARLWQLYQARYREIAKSAEDRFLGDVGADFRDAYDAKKGQE